MSGACTIFGSKVDYLAVYNIVSGMSPVSVEVAGVPQEWQTLGYAYLPTSCQRMCKPGI